MPAKTKPRPARQSRLSKIIANELRAQVPPRTETFDEGFDRLSANFRAPQGGSAPAAVSEEVAAEYKADLTPREIHTLRQIVQNEVSRRGIQTRDGSDLWSRIEREAIHDLRQKRLSLSEIYFD